jgi:hypothetical protein
VAYNSYTFTHVFTNYNVTSITNAGSYRISNLLNGTVLAVAPMSGRSTYAKILGNYADLVNAVLNP